MQGLFFILAILVGTIIAIAALGFIFTLTGPGILFLVIGGITFILIVKLLSPVLDYIVENF